MMKGGHGPTKLLSDSDCDAFDYASHAPQSLSGIYHHYTNLTVVRESVCLSVTGRSTEAIRTALKSFLFRHRWTWMLQQAAH